jgi:hypothetical protein
VNKTNLISTRVLLQDLGFAPDANVNSDELPGLSFDFGTFKLQASWQLNRRFVPIVLLSGIYSTSRTIAIIEQQLPLDIESADQGKAFIAWCLQDGIGDPYRLKITPGWLTEGRKYFHLLPWKREEVKYEARPRCHIRRDWARVALKELGKYLALARQDERVLLSFDGEALRVQIGNERMVLQAHGQAWPENYSIAVGALTRLPRRLTRDPIEVSIVKPRLRIDHCHYSEVLAEQGEET